MKRLAITLTILAVLTAGAAYACNPVGYNVGTCGAVGYHQTVAVAVPYTPVAAVAVQYQAVAVAAPAAYEPPQVQAPVAAPQVQMSYATVAAPQVAYTQVAAAPCYAGCPVNVGVAHYGAVGARRVGVAVATPYVAANVAVVKVGVANVGRRHAPATVTVVRANTGRVGLRERIQVRRAAVRATRAAR